MGEVAALFRPWQNNTTSLIMSMQYTGGGGGGAHFSINGRRWWRSKPKKQQQQQQCYLLLMRRRSCSFFESKAMMFSPPSTYSSTIATDVPLSESPSVSVIYIFTLSHSDLLILEETEFWKWHDRLLSIVIWTISPESSELSSPINQEPNASMRYTYMFMEILYINNTTLLIDILQLPSIT